MRYLRKQVLNRRAPWDQRLSVDINNAVVMNTTNNLTIPTGTTAQQPVVPVDGMIRYNSSTNEFEGRQAGQWRSFRFKESAPIIQQSLGAGDSINLYFGPLDPIPPVPSKVQSNATWGGQNLIVVVENVIQLSSTNYTVVTDPSIPTQTYYPKLSVAALPGDTTLYFNTHLFCNTTVTTSAGFVTLYFDIQPQKPFAVNSSITVSGFIPNGYNGVYNVSAVSTTSVTYQCAGTGTITVAGQVRSANAVYTSVDLMGASVTIPGSVIPANASVVSVNSNIDTDALISISVAPNKAITGPVSTNTTVTINEATQTKTGYYLKFTSPVPYGKMVTVLHGFDK